jgi:hypothetical protein
VAAPALASRVASWPRLPRPATPDGIPKLQSPARGPAGTLWQFGGCRGSGPRGHPRCRGGGRVRCAPRNRAKGRAGRHARGTGEGCSGGSRRACDVRRGQNGPCTSHCVVARCCAAGLGLCRSATSAGVRRGGAPRWPRRLSVFQLSVFKTTHTHPPTLHPHTFGPMARRLYGIYGMHGSGS